MFKEVDSKLVPNQFLFNHDTQYVKSAKIKSKIKEKIISKKEPFADQTNKLSSMQNYVTPQHLQLIGYQTDSNSQTQHTNVKENCGLTNNSVAFVDTLKAEYIQKQTNIINKQNQNINTIPSTLKNQSKQKINQNNNLQPKQKQINKKSELERKKIFQLNFSSQNQSQQEQIKNPTQQQKIEESEVKNIFQQFKPVAKRNITKFNVQFSEGSSSEQTQTVKQAVINPRLAEKTNDRKNVILNKFESDSQDQGCENNQIQQSQGDEQSCQIIRNMNFKKLKTHFQYTQAEQNFIAFCPIPQQNKISLIIKRNTNKSQYTVYDNQLVTLIMKVERSMGGNYKFVFNKDDKSNEKSIDLIAKMKSNFIGTQFHCYTYKQSDGKKQKYQSISINYDVNILGLNGPRKVKLFATKKPLPGQQNLLQLYQGYEKNDKSKTNANGEYGGIKLYQNKNPKWMQQMNAYVLNLRGTAAHSSIKNCIIVDSTNQNKQHLIFGKKAKDIFNLEVKHPMTILQGVAFAVSSFERKLACQ